MRYFVSEGFELFCAQSFSKNFGLYSECPAVSWPHPDRWGWRAGLGKGSGGELCFAATRGTDGSRLLARLQMNAWGT